MKASTFKLMRFDADEGMVFDWEEPRYELDEEGNEVQIHLYVKTLFIGPTDSISNYIEVEEEA